MKSFGRMRDQLKAKLSGSSMASQALVISGAAIAAQVIGFVVGPINSRLYTPLNFGVLGTFSAIFSIFTELAAMRYNEVLPVAEDENEAMHIMLLCFIIAIAWAVLASLVVIIAGHWLARKYLNTPLIADYFWILPIGFFATSTFAILSSWAIRKRAFTKLSIARINQSLLGSGCTVTMGLFHKGVVGLLTGLLVAMFAGIRKLIVVAYKDFQAERPRLSFAGIKRVAKRYYRYPLFNTGSAVMIAFSSQVPVWFLGQGFALECVGYFAMSNRMLNIPAALIGQAIQPVFFSRIKQAQKDGTLKAMTMRLLDAIVGVDVFFMMFLAIFGDLFFSIVFGARWHRSGQYAAAMAPWLLTSFLVQPLYTLPFIFERQATVLIFQGVLLAVRIGSLMIGIHFKNDLLAMWLFGGLSTIYMLIYLGWMLHLVEAPIWPPLVKLGRELLLAIVMLGSCRLLLHYTGNRYLTAIALAPVLAYGAFRGLRQLNRARSIDSVGTVTP